MCGIGYDAEIDIRRYILYLLFLFVYKKFLHVTNKLFTLLPHHHHIFYIILLLFVLHIDVH